MPLPASRKSRALLVWLWMHPGPQRRERLAGLLWHDVSDPRAGLRWSLNQLRGLLGDALQTTRDTVALNHQKVRTDLDALREALREPDLRYLPDYKSAMSALESTYLPGLDCGDNPEYEAWLASARAKLAGLHCELLNTLVALTADRARESLDYARKLVGIDPLGTSSITLHLRGVLAVEGRAAARKCLEQHRLHLREAGVDEAKLLAAWRQLCPPASTTASHDTLEEPSPPLALPAKPSLAVLALDTLGNPAVATLAQGLVADLVTRLSRIGGLFVIARASSTRLNPQQYSLADIGRLLGVRYLLHGCLQGGGKGIHANLELADAVEGKVVWVDSIAASPGELFEAQEHIAARVVSAVGPEIERAEFERASLKQPDSMDAWEHYHMALWHSFRFTARDTETAFRHVQQALGQDRRFCRAHALLSLVHFNRAFLDSSPRPQGEIDRALACAEQSMVLDERDPMARWSLGRAQFLNRQHDQALYSLDRALQANPNYAQGHYARGFVGVHAGVADTALPELEMAQRLSPFDPLLFAMISSRAISLALQGDYESAARCALEATREANAHYHINAVAAACLALAGREAEARRQIAIARRAHPGYTRDAFFRSFPYKHPEQQQLMAQALERAGLQA